MERQHSWTPTKLKASRERYKEITNILREIEVRPVDKPLNPHYIRLKFAKSIENQFNQFWYHMYKILADIESRRYCSNSKKVLEDRELLTKYAKRAVQLWGSKGSSPLDSNNELNEINPPLKKGLSKIKYIDATDTNSKAREMQDARTSQFNSKYKKRVLEALELPLSEEFFQKTSKRKPKIEFGQELVPVKQTLISTPPSKIHPIISIKRIHAARKSSQKATPSVPQFTMEHKMKEFKAYPIFCSEILQPLDKYEPSPEVVVNRHSSEPNLQLQEKPVPIKKIFLQKMITPAKEKTIVEKLSEQIYGKRRRNIYTAIGTRDTVADHMYLKIRGRNEKLAQRTAQKANKTASSNFFITEKKMCGRQPQVCSLPVSRRNSKEHLDPIHKLLDECVVEQERADQGLNEIKKLHKAVTKNLGSIQSGIERLKGVDSEAKEYVKRLTEKKHLFIYGKNGHGRYLAVDGKDMVKISDQMSKINPKYDFLKKRMSEIVDNEPLF